MKIITVTALVFLPFILLYALWIGTVGLLGSFAKKKRYRAGTEHTFAVVICARNEEKVIAKLLSSLERQTYPKDKYKVFVVAHNCTDATAEVAHRAGAEVFVRKAKGEYKAAALAFGLDEIARRYGDFFEYYAVFDADALAEKRFLRKSMRRWTKRAPIARQGLTAPRISLSIP